MAPLRSLGNIFSAFNDFYARTGKDAAGAVDTSALIATGGNSVFTDGGFKYHAFTSSGSFVVTKGAGEKVQYLIVAGGGGGGANNGGGGGAGGLRWEPTPGEGYSLPAAGSYAVVIGAGGGGGPPSSPGSDGGDSSVFGLTSTGGGGGGAAPNGPTSGRSGGSGGGGTRSGSGVQVTLHQSHHLKEIVVVLRLIRQTVRMVVAAVVLALPVVLVMDLVAMVFKFLGFHQHMEHQMVALPALDGSLVVVAVVLKLLLRAVMVALVVAAVADLEAYLVGVAVVPINTVMVEVLTLVVAAVEKDLLVPDLVVDQVS